VVGVRHQAVAPRRGAAVVAQDEQPAQETGEDAPPGVHGDEVPAVGRGVEPADPHGRVTCLADPLASNGRRDGAVPRDPCGLCDTGATCRAADGGAEQRRVGHDEVYLERLHLAHGPAGEQPRRRVGHDRPEAAPVGSLVVALPADHGGGPGAQRGVGAHGLAQGRQHGEVGHAVGCGTNGDPAGSHRLLHPPDHGRGVELGRHLGRSPGERADAEPAEQGAEAAVDLGAVVERQRGGGLHDRNGVPLPDDAVGEGSHRAGHLVDQRP
jgi:hypothetical protein